MTKIQNIVLAIEPKTFVKEDTKEIISYYDCCIILPSGADLRVKLSNETARLLHSGILQ